MVKRVRTVYVYLLNEGVDCWAPTLAEDLGGGRYRLMRPADYNPEVDEWEFPPGTVVSCEVKTFGDGSEELVATAAEESGGSAR